MGIETILLTLFGSVATGVLTNEAQQGAEGARLMGGLPVEMITMLG